MVIRKRPKKAVARDQRHICLMGAILVCVDPSPESIYLITAIVMALLVFVRFTLDSKEDDD